MIITVTSRGGATIQTTSTSAPPPDPPTFTQKFAGWWLEGTSQIGGTDLVGSDPVQLPAGLEADAELIALNTWYGSDIPLASIAQYDGNRQWYSPTNNELIILKEGQHLDEAEEAILIAWINPIIPTAYNSNTTALIARFTNSYTGSEKSKMDNLMRLLDDSGLLDKMDLLYLPSIGKTEEAMLDWKSAVNDLTLVDGHAGVENFKGLWGQNGYFDTGYSPLNDGVQFTQDDAFVSFKLAQDMIAPDENKIYGVLNATSNVIAQFEHDNNGLRLINNINSPGITQFRFVGPVNKTFVHTRTGTTVKVIKEDTISLNLGGASTSGTPPAGNLFLTDRASTTGTSIIPMFNYMQHYAMGAYLTDAEASLLGRFIDNYCDGQLTRANEWIQASGYRYKLNDKFIVSRVGEDKIVWHDYNSIFYSEDNGVTTLASGTFSQLDNGWFTNFHLFDNGKIIFATSQNRWYKTTSALTSIVEIFAVDENDQVYAIHTPTTPGVVGEYFNHINIKKKTYLGDSTEIFVFAPYGNNLRGANPLVVWYSFGDTIKVAYEFGQNQYFTDDGTIDGGTGGILLGDAGNAIKSRHLHDIQQNPDSLNDWYATFGDLDRTEFFESMHMKFTYTQGTDSWVGVVIRADVRTSRWKGTGSQMPGDGNYYWAADESNDIDERGMWMCPIASIADEGSHTRLYEQIDPDNALLHFNVNSDLFLLGAGYSHSVLGGVQFASVNIWWSDDLITFHEDRLAMPGAAWGQLITEYAPKKYQIDLVTEWKAFYGSQSLIIDFN